MINFQVAEFVKSAFAKDDHLYDHPHILFIGKSNVGKSSLINALTNRARLAYVSKTPGQTKLVNYYLIDHAFYLVDVPGFGYRKLAYEKDSFDRMMSEYLEENPCIRTVAYLLDSRRKITGEEQGVIDYIAALGYPIIIIFTKCDKLKQSDKARLSAEIRASQVKEYLFASVRDMRMIDGIRKYLEACIE